MPITSSSPADRVGRVPHPAPAAPAEQADQSTAAPPGEGLPASGRSAARRVVVPVAVVASGALVAGLTLMVRAGEGRAAEGGSDRPVVAETPIGADLGARPTGTGSGLVTLPSVDRSQLPPAPAPAAVLAATPVEAAGSGPAPNAPSAPIAPTATAVPVAAPPASAGVAPQPASPAPPAAAPATAVLSAPASAPPTTAAPAPAPAPTAPAPSLALPPVVSPAAPSDPRPPTPPAPPAPPAPPVVNLPPISLSIGSQVAGGGNGDPDRGRNTSAGNDNRGNDNRGNENRGNDNRGNDNRGNDNRGDDDRGSNRESGGRNGDD